MAAVTGNTSSGPAAFLPAALQVLSVTFGFKAWLGEERNQGLDRKWQLDMSSSLMAKQHLVSSLDVLLFGSSQTRLNGCKKKIKGCIKEIG